MSGTIKVGSPFLFEIFVVDPTTGLGKTGLTLSDFTVSVFKDGTYQSSPPTVTKAELSSSHAPGTYTISMTPNAAARWFFFITHTVYGGAGWNDHVHAYVQDIDSLIGALFVEPLANWEGTCDLHSIGMLVALGTNKVSISGNTLSVYKTDGTTLLQTFTLAFDASQNPIKTSTPS